MTISSSSPVLGLGGYLSAEEATRLSERLRRLWELCYESPPLALDSDLEACRRWFDPVAQGQRLRRELASLAPLPSSLEDPGPPLTLDAGEGKVLITPEGRCVLDLLDHLPSDLPGHTIRASDTAGYETRLALLYRGWSRHRIQTVVDLLKGATKPLQIPAAGVLIALLVNRCTSEDRALTRFSSGREQSAVDKAFFAAVSSFSSILAPSSRAKRDPRLVSGWMLFEARRRLGKSLRVVESRANQNGKTWIPANDVNNVIEIVTRDLARGHRARATTKRFALAFDALVDALRRELPTLAGFGLVHERPVETRQLREKLLSALDRHIADG